MSDFPIIRSNRCCMTIMTMEDTGWLYELFNDEDVKKNLEGIRLFSDSKDATAVFIDSMLEAYYTERGFLWKIMCEEIPVGFVCSADFDENPYICYAMNRNFRNMGLMTEAVMAVLDYQNTIEYKSYMISVNKDNVSSCRVCNWLEDKFNNVAVFYK